MRRSTLAALLALFFAAVFVMTMPVYADPGDGNNGTNRSQVHDPSSKSPQVPVLPDAENRIIDAHGDGAGDPANKLVIPEVTVAAAAAAAATTSTTFTPNADARTSEAAPTTNYSTYILLVDGAGDPQLESYVRFNVSNLSGAVQNAKLRLYATSATVLGPTVYMASSSWTETGITWNTRPARTSGVIASGSSIAANTWVEYDVTSALQGNGTYTFDLAAASSDGVDFGPRESGTQAPQLVVTTASTTTDPGTTSSVTLKDTNYAIPSSGAYFVSASGSDTNSGTQASPWRTIQKAVNSAPAGSTIVIRTGTYRESVALANKQLTLQPYSHEQVWLKGSDIVTGWVADGTAWRKDGWTYQFKQGGISADFTDPAYPLAAYPDMVYINGQPLTQVATRAEVTAGKFYVDYANAKLYIGTNPTAQTVEAATRKQGLVITNASGTIVRGIGFMHYANHPDDYGAVKADATSLTFENNTFAWNAAAGLQLLAADGVVRGNLFLYNGQVGFVGYNADRLLFEQNRMAYNNQEHFKYSFAAGGMKVLASRDMTWRDNLAEYNYGKGFWADGSCYNTTIVRNTVRNNDHHGINYEISAKVIIASNVVVNNNGAGVQVLESQDVDIFNNTFSRNYEDVRIIEGSRYSTADPLISWNVSDIVVKNNILSNGTSTSKRLFIVDDVSAQKSANAMGVTANYNAYFRTSSTSPSILVLWAQWPNNPLMPNTLAQFKSGTGQEASGVALDNLSVNPFFVDETNGDYHLKTGSVAIGAGSPLPSAIAAAIGVRAGVPVNLGALIW